MFSYSKIIYLGRGVNFCLGDHEQVINLLLTFFHAPKRKNKVYYTVLKKNAVASERFRFKTKYIVAVTKQIRRLFLTNIL